MTKQELRDSIVNRAKEDPEFAAVVASKDTTRIAEAYSAGRVRLTERLIGIGTVLSALGPVEGVALLDALEGLQSRNRLVYWAWFLLKEANLDVGNPVTRAQIQEFGNRGVITAEGVAKLLTLAELPNPIDEFDVRKALLADDGGWNG